jgi:hypothetical protein
MTDEAQDLDNLLKHPGWLRVVDHGLADIEGRVRIAMVNAVGERDDIMALNLLRQCLAAKQAVEQFIAWPGMRLKGLQTNATASTAPQLSRRGPL